MGGHSVKLTRREVVALGVAAALGLVVSRRAAAEALDAAAPRIPTYVTQPGWSPPPIVVSTPTSGTATGSIFLAPISFGAAGGAPPMGRYGPLIVDDEGEPIWFLPLTNVTAHNFRVQTYREQPVLTWYEGPANGTYGGSCVIYDDTYHEVKRVHAGHGLACDLHEFLITSRGTVLMAIYNEVAADLSSVGGPTNGRLVEGVVQELELPSGRVLFEWHSLDHIPVTESLRTGLTAAGNVDYLHLNSIGVDADGNLLVSARHTSTVYKLDRKTGAVQWRLGGKSSDFTFGPGAAFNFQHDARDHADGTLTVFDNGASDPAAGKVEAASRPLRLSLDLSAMTASLVEVYNAGVPPRLAIALGDVQGHPDGNVFVGWGAAGPFSEFGPAGDLRFDATFGDGSVTYRALRFPWVGRPTTKPAIAAQANAGGTMTVYASWNGATEVARWQVRGGATPNSLKPLRTSARSGFETAITVPAASAYVAVTALDASGAVLGTSAVVRV